MDTIRIYTITPNKKGKYEKGTAIISARKSDLLKQFYEILNCDCVECKVIEVQGKKYDIWVDEEAKIKAYPAANLWLGPVNHMGQCVCNSVIITHHLTDNRPLKSLTIEEVEALDNWVYESQYDLMEAFKKGILGIRYSNRG